MVHELLKQVENTFCKKQEEKCIQSSINNRASSTPYKLLQLEVDHLSLEEHGLNCLNLCHYAGISHNLLSLEATGRAERPQKPSSAN